MTKSTILSRHGSLKFLVISVCFRPQGETKDLKDEVTDGVIEVRHEY